MKYLLKMSLLVMLLTLLAACGGDDDSNNTGANTSTDETGFTSTITGAVETELNGRGYFQCEEGGFGELVIGASGGLSNNILIIVPVEATAGSTYQIVTERMSADQASAAYVGEDLQTAYYQDNVSGSITLDAVPTKEGEQVAGSFEFTASADEEKTVTITGSFDFIVGPNAFYNCSSGE